MIRFNARSAIRLRVIENNTRRAKEMAVVLEGTVATATAALEAANRVDDQVRLLRADLHSALTAGSHEQAVTIAAALDTAAVSAHDAHYYALDVVRSL